MFGLAQDRPGSVQRNDREGREAVARLSVPHLVYVHAHPAHRTHVTLCARFCPDARGSPHAAIHMVQRWVLGVHAVIFSVPVQVLDPELGEPLSQRDVCGRSRHVLLEHRRRRWQGHLYSPWLEQGTARFRPPPFRPRQTGFALPPLWTSIGFRTQLHRMQIPALYYFPGNNKKGGSYTGENSEGDFAKFIEKRLQKTKNSKKKSSEEL